MKYALVTFGCRVNQADSLEAEARLRAGGGEPAALSDADVVVVNTCSVTASADQGARQAIRRVARENPRARIVATGCFATRGAADVAALPGVTAVVPNDAKASVAHVAISLAGGTTAERFGTGDGACGEVAPGLGGRTAWTLRVQTGCEERCTYCIIPRTRGRSRSRPLADVLGEVERLARAGYREVALTGVHLGAYGRDLSPAASLAALLREIARLDAGLLFRVSSLEPMDCSDAVLDLVSGEPAFAPHLHLPLQHGCDDLLRAMRRPYTARQYERLVRDVRQRVPHAAIGTDLIAGFPGETDERFEEGLAFVESLPLTHLHVFPYSDRPGTVAASLPGHVHGARIRERAERVRAVGRRMEAAFRGAQLGRVHAALTIEDGAVAFTDNYLKVRIRGGRARNERVFVRIDATSPVLTGTVVATAA